MKIGEIAAQDLQGIVGLLACSLAGMMPKSAKHLGPVKVVENSKFQQELDRFVADKPDEEALSFGAYNTITRAQSPSPKGLCQNLEFISILLKVFPTGRALPTFLQSSCIAVLDKYREKGRKFAGSFPHEQFARWFTKRCQVFLAHAREIGRNGFSEFQRSKISKAQADRIDAVCQPLAAHPHEGLSHDSLEEEDCGDEGEGMPAMDMAALLLDMWTPPAQRVTPKKKKAKTAHETPEKQDHGDDILKHAQKVAEKPIPRGSLAIKKRPAGKTGGPQEARGSTTYHETASFGRTRLSHFEHTSYIQFYTEEGRWSSLANFAKALGVENRREKADLVWAWLIEQGSGITKEVVQAKRQSVMKSTGDTEVPDSGWENSGESGDDFE